MVLGVILVFLGVVLVVLEVTGPQVAPTQVDPTVPSLIICPVVGETDTGRRWSFFYCFLLVFSLSSL